jgi:hypothetical protein
MPDLQYYDGSQWISLGSGGSLGVSTTDLNDAITAALAPYVTTTAFTTALSNYVTTAQLAGAIASQLASVGDTRYVQLNPASNAEQNINGRVNIRRDLFLYDDPVTKTGARLEISTKPTGLADVQTRIMARHSTGARNDILIEPNGNNSFLQLGAWDQNNTQTTVVMTRYVQFTAGLLNKDDPRPITTDAKTGEVNAFDFTAKNGVKTTNGPNILRGSNYIGLDKVQDKNEARLIVTVEAEPNIRAKGSLTTSALTRFEGPTVAAGDLTINANTTANNWAGKNFGSAANTNLRAVLLNASNVVGSRKLVTQTIQGSTTSVIVVGPSRSSADVALDLETTEIAFNDEQGVRVGESQLAILAEEVVNKFGGATAVFDEETGEVIEASLNPVVASLIQLAQRQQQQLNELGAPDTWKNLSLRNSSGDSARPPQYRVAGDTVQFRGRINFGKKSGWVGIVAVLPSELKLLKSDCPVSGMEEGVAVRYARIELKGTGNLEMHVETIGNTNTISLDGAVAYLAQGA